MLDLDNIITENITNSIYLSDTVKDVHTTQMLNTKYRRIILGRTYYMNMLQGELLHHQDYEKRCAKYKISSEQCFDLLRLSSAKSLIGL